MNILAFSSGSINQRIFLISVLQSSSSTPSRTVWTVSLAPSAKSVRRKLAKSSDRCSMENLYN